MQSIRHSHSHEEAIAIAKQWMRDNYGIARDLPEASRDKYHERLGLLVDFIHTLCPSDKK